MIKMEHEVHNISRRKTPFLMLSYGLRVGVAHEPIQGVDFNQTLHTYLL